MSVPMVEVEHLSKSVAKGEVIGIIGPSGSGKSTLLRCINFLEIPGAGVITIDGERVTIDSHAHSKLSGDKIAHLQSKVGMVFQQFNLFPHMTAIQNIISGPRYVLKEKPEVYEDKAMRSMPTLKNSPVVNNREWRLPAPWP
jgi:ABC-type polar amino acid transport system ATPase subunit